MDKIREILLFFSAAMAVFAMICAVYQAMHERNSSATVLGGLFLVSVLVVFLPKLEVLEAWGVKAHLVRTLNEADEILAKLRQLAITNAKAVYMNVSWGNRMGSPSAKDKQAMVDEVDAQLRDLKVSADERKALTSTYVRLIGFDLYMTYVQTLQRYWQFKQQAMRQEAAKDSTNEDLKAELERLGAGLREWKPDYQMFGRLGTVSFDDEIKRVTPSGWLGEREQRAVNSYRDEMLRLFKGVADKGGFTTEAAAYYDTYHDLAGQDKKIKELFDFNPSALQ